MANVSTARVRESYHRFRILVIGRANAGKTTLLQRVCNTRRDPQIYDEGKNILEPTSARGIHDINRPFAFKSNPKFIFHDSPGFESGDADQLGKVLDFITEHARATDLNKQLHAIWFCFGPDVSRPILPLEEDFFNQQRAGNVPVIAIFTKFDIILTHILDPEMSMEENHQVAKQTLDGQFIVRLNATKFPPKAFIALEEMQKTHGNHQAQVKALITATADSLDGVSLKLLFVSVQKNNLEICLYHAIQYELRYFAKHDDYSVVSPLPKRGF